MKKEKGGCGETRFSFTIGCFLDFETTTWVPPIRGITCPSGSHSENLRKRQNKKRREIERNKFRCSVLLTRVQ